jgi:hypothetical protein
MHMLGIRALILLVTLLASFSAFAVDGNDWRAASGGDRLTEMRRVLGNIKSRGCTVRQSPEYFVRQINDFYNEPGTRGIPLPKALGLIATGAGENWKC